mgnify:CR=1 FL=1
MKRLMIISILFLFFTAINSFAYENICKKEETAKNPLCKTVGYDVYLKFPNGDLTLLSKVIGITWIKKGETVTSFSVAPADNYYYMCENVEGAEPVLSAVGAENIVVTPPGEKPEI